MRKRPARTDSEGIRRRAGVLRGTTAFDRGRNTPAKRFPGRIGPGGEAGGECVPSNPTRQGFISCNCLMILRLVPGCNRCSGKFPGYKRKKTGERPRQKPDAEHDFAGKNSVCPDEPFIVLSARLAMLFQCFLLLPERMCCPNRMGAAKRPADAASVETRNFYSVDSNDCFLFSKKYAFPVSEKRAPLSTGRAARRHPKKWLVFPHELSD